MGEIPSPLGAARRHPLRNVGWDSVPLVLWRVPSLCIRVAGSSCPGPHDHDHDQKKDDTAPSENGIGEVQTPTEGSKPLDGNGTDGMGPSQRTVGTEQVEAVAPELEAAPPPV